MPDDTRIESAKAMGDYIAEAMEGFARSLESQGLDYDVPKDIESVGAGVLLVKFRGNRQFRITIQMSKTGYAQRDRVIRAMMEIGGPATKREIRHRAEEMYGPLIRPQTVAGVIENWKTHGIPERQMFSEDGSATPWKYWLTDAGLAAGEEAKADINESETEQ